MKTKAAVLNQSKQDMTIETLELEAPREHEVLVRLAASGLCHSDYHVIKGEWDSDFPIVLGHEGAGIVEQVGHGVRNVATGDHVLLSWVPYCGYCDYCLAGRPILCSETQHTSNAGLMLDGTTRMSRAGESVYSYCATATFATRTIVPETGVIPIRKDAPLDKIAIIGCAVTTGVGAVINTVGVKPNDSVLVIGCGGVGLSAIMGANLAAAGQIIAVDLSDDSLDRAIRLGATKTINSSRDDLDSELRQLVGEDGVDYAFEAIGLANTIEEAYRAIRPGGTAVVVGQAADGVTISIDPFTMSDREKKLIGSSYGSSHPAREFPRLVDLYMNGRLDLEALISNRIQLEEINEGFAVMDRGESARTVILYE